MASSMSAFQKYLHSGWQGFSGGATGGGVGGGCVGFGTEGGFGGMAGGGGGGGSIGGGGSMGRGVAGGKGGGKCGAGGTAGVGGVVGGDGSPGEGGSRGDGGGGEGVGGGGGCGGGREGGEGGGLGSPRKRPVTDEPPPRKVLIARGVSLLPLLLPSVGTTDASRQSTATQNTEARHERTHRFRSSGSALCFGAWTRCCWSAVKLSNSSPPPRSAMVLAVCVDR